MFFASLVDLPQMSGQFAAAVECFATFRTYVGAFACVRSHMHLYVRFVCEPLMTNWALERFLAGVRYKVTFQIVVSAELTAARCAVQSIPDVMHQMFLDEVTVVEQPATYVAFILALNLFDWLVNERIFFGEQNILFFIDIDVRCHGLLAGEDATTMRTFVLFRWWQTMYVSVFKAGLLIGVECWAIGTFNEVWHGLMGVQVPQTITGESLVATLALYVVFTGLCRGLVYIVGIVQAITHPYCLVPFHFSYAVLIRVTVQILLKSEQAVIHIGKSN